MERQEKNQWMAGKRGWTISSTSLKWPPGTSGSWYWCVEHSWVMWAMCPLTTWRWEPYQCRSSRIIPAFYLGDFTTLFPSQDLQIAAQFTLLRLQAGYREGNKGQFNSCCSPTNSVLRNELSCGTRPKQLGISGSVWYETDAKRLIYKILVIL